MRTRAAGSVVAALSIAAWGGTRLATAAGTGAGQPLPSGTSQHTLMVDGLQRTYQVYRPVQLPVRAPLVVMLHGGYGSGAQAERAYGWDARADQGRFAVAYPDGLDRAWNTEGGCCGRPAANHVDDVAFIEAMVEAIEADVPVDPGRVYATGISNGGIMSYTLACRTRLFAAIGPDSATELAPCPNPAPLSVIHIHGAADPTIRYDGGPGQDVGVVIDGPAIPEVNARWRAIDGCAQPTIVTRGDVTTSIAACPQHRAVELITIAGAGHQWPGARPNLLAERLLHANPPSTALDATATIWRFFAAHPRPAS